MRVLGRGWVAVLWWWIATAAIAAPAERVGIWEWEGASRVVAIGDLHGAYNKLVSLLESSDLVDDALQWSGGDAHLVVAGDLLDRGPSERALVDLLRRLQEESEAAGGYVHVLLGNHESMNLMRDTRYVNRAAYADFTDHETAADRKAGWKSYVAQSGGGRPVDLREAYNDRYPPGYFGRLKVLDREGEIGSWLLTLPAIIRIDGVVYVHGGLTEAFAGLGIDGINRQVLDQLTVHLESREVLEAARVVSATMTYKEVIQTVQFSLAGSGRRKLSGKSRTAAKALLQSVGSPILGGSGPLWYRGNSLEDERIERDMLERSLEKVGAQAMVVAHSYTGGNRITSRFQGHLYRLDHGILKSPRPLALIVESQKVMVLDSGTGELSQPVPELPIGEQWPIDRAEMTDQNLESFLNEGRMTDSQAIGRGTTRPQIVVLEKDGQIQRGIFKVVEEGRKTAPGESADRYENELAAYRLDRRLGLNLVPVTVLRKLDGQRGSLQWWVQGAVDQEAAEEFDLQVLHGEATRRQLAEGEVFDALIGNRDRKRSDILCLVNGDRIFLVDHSRAFPDSTELFWGDRRPSRIDPELLDALAALDRETLAEDLGDLLDEGQLAALIARRDAILDQAAAPMAR